MLIFNVFIYWFDFLDNLDLEFGLIESIWNLIFLIGVMGILIFSIGILVSFFSMVFIDFMLIMLIGI